MIKQFLFIVFLFGLASANAQTTLQVVSKSTNKEFTFQEGQTVVVEGEKAEIKVETWDQPQVVVSIILFAKNPDRAVAENELKSFNFTFEEESDRILIRNYYSGSAKAKSELTAQYFVKVPTDCPVQMSNYFGKTDVENLSANLDVNSQFGPISMYNIEGDIGIVSRFGDIFGELLNGNVKIESHRSNVTLKRLQGKYDIKSKYGLIKVFADNRLIDLNIEAEKADVYLFNPEPTESGYELISHFGDITLPEELKINFVENSDTKRHAVYTPGQQQIPGVFVKITYGDIIVKKNPKP